MGTAGCPCDEALVGQSSAPARLRAGWARLMKDSGVVVRIVQLSMISPLRLVHLSHRYNS